MQLAVVLGFSSGNLGLSTALDTIRKLQRDRATIDLNRTAIAFGQGDDTFGWRFQPRFQTPPVESNAKVFFRDLVIGGPTDRQLERSSEIEPGMRECTAIILMPSFVPYVSFETHGHWFKLDNPGHTGTSVQEDVHLSRAIKQMQDRAAMCIRCAHLYRDGQVERVMARVEQLEKRLPLQTISCQVPNENTHGGFELFCNGTRQLSPEITGWYGSPGYNPESGADFFISGDNFSIKQTHLIAGNQVIAPEEFSLISRQILQVRLPKGLPVMKDTRLLEHNNEKIASDQQYDGYIDVQVATPYGVSAHLLLPVLRAEVPEPISECPPSAPTIEDANMTLELMRNTRNGFDDLLAESPMLPVIELPANTMPGVPKCKVHLYLTHGTARLTPVEFANVPRSRSKTGFQIPADSFLASTSGNGKLLSEIKQYASFLDSHGKIPDEGGVIEFTAEYSLEDDNAELPVEGSFPMIVEIAPKQDAAKK
jgi:hypothetical protein